MFRVCLGFVKGLFRVSFTVLEFLPRFLKDCTLILYLNVCVCVCVHIYIHIYIYMYTVEI